MRSVLAQTEREIELIVVNDASPDNAADVVHTYLKADSRVSSYRNAENLGLAASQNIGISAARAPWVLKVDADDWISETYVEKILTVASLRPDVNVVFSPAHVFGDKEYVYRYPQFHAGRMREELMIPGPAAFRRDLWAAVGGYDESMRSAEDWDLYIRAQLVVGLTPFQLDSPLWHYRQHAGVRASQHGMDRLRYLQAYWSGHTRENVLAHARTWSQWCAERKVAA